MSWNTSDRRSQLPLDWPTRRRRILERDGHQCTEVVNGVRCTHIATEVDHIRPGDNHDDTNLRSLCRWHHARKSSAEGNAARTRPTSRRPIERHPGLL